MQVSFFFIAYSNVLIFYKYYSYILDVYIRSYILFIENLFIT